MSIVLANSVRIPLNLSGNGGIVEAKSHSEVAGPHYTGANAEVVVGDIAMTLPDFCELVKYVMTNTKVEVMDDPRLALKDYLDKLRVVQTDSGKGFMLVLGDPLFAR